MADRHVGLARLGSGPDSTVWLDRVQRGLVQICLPTILEVGYRATSGTDWIDKIDTPPLSLMPLATIAPAAESRAVEVQGLLPHQGRHRAPSVNDLIVAEVAEVASLTILYLDKDFELIASVTGQPVERRATG